MPELSKGWFIKSPPKNAENALKSYEGAPIHAKEMPVKSAQFSHAGRTMHT